MRSVNSNNKSSHVASNFAEFVVMILEGFVCNLKNSFTAVVA